MILPFTYRREFFTRVLALSLLAHIVIFMAPSFFFSPPRYNVDLASNSMEIALLDDPAIKNLPAKEKTSAVLTTKTNSVMESVLVSSKAQAAQPKKQAEKPMLPPPTQAVFKNKGNEFKNPPPVYPEMARAKGWEGTVFLKVHVLATGLPDKIEIDQSSGYDLLDEAAVSAVKNWHFSPPRLGGVPVSTWVKIPVKFSLSL